jgi:hypothetical protein
MFNVLGQRYDYLMCGLVDMRISGLVDYLIWDVLLSCDASFIKANFFID